MAFSLKHHTKGLKPSIRMRVPNFWHVALEHNAENILVNFIGRVQMYEEVRNRNHFNRKNYQDRA